MRRRSRTQPLSPMKETVYLWSMRMGKQVNTVDRWVLIRRAAEVTGYTQSAIRTKIKLSVWTRGRHWCKGPDNRVFVDLQAIQRWVVGD